MSDYRAIVLGLGGIGSAAAYWLLCDLSQDGATDLDLSPFAADRTILKEENPVRSYMVRRRGIPPPGAVAVVLFGVRECGGNGRGG